MGWFSSDEDEEVEITVAEPAYHAIMQCQQDGQIHREWILEEAAKQEAENRRFFYDGESYRGQRDYGYEVVRDLRRVAGLMESKINVRVRTKTVHGVRHVVIGEHKGKR